jgi:GntR family transcriptional regulator of arabinose operon
MIYLLVRQALEKMGRSIPDDYSLVCFDYSDENLEKAGITCSITRSYEMGCELGKRLMRMIENKNCDDKNYSHIMTPVIYDGTSIRRI